MAADSRNFTEHFDMQGNPVYIEDKRMEELKSATAKTSSQISTTTDYIPLQDTDGNLVKINPASFQEAVRNALGSLLANNDKGTTISGVPALSGSGASLDFGSVTPANLASVLGVTPSNILRQVAFIEDNANIDSLSAGYYQWGQKGGLLVLGNMIQSTLNIQVHFMAATGTPPVPQKIKVRWNWSGYATSNWSGWVDM